MSSGAAAAVIKSNAITESDVSAYLQHIKETNALGRSARRLALLEYLIRCEIQGEGEKLKAYSIGRDVFDKADSFDPTIDSSVRVEIGRLRDRIALFEASDQATTVLRVEIPVGTYRPMITKRIVKVVDVEDEIESSPAPLFPNRRMSVLAALTIAMFVTMGFATGWLGPQVGSETQHSSDDGLHPIVLTIEDLKGGDLAREVSFMVKESFSSYSTIKLVDQPYTRPRDGHFILRGAVSTTGDLPSISVELADVASNEIVWTKIFKLRSETDIKDQVDTKLNGELETRLIGATKRLLEKYDPKELTAQQLFILGTWVSGPAENSLTWEAERVNLMKIALEKDPDFGPAHSVLADKYGFLANVYPTWDTPENLRLSRFHAERAQALAPLDPNAMFNVAQSHWHAGRHRESARIFKRVTELDSGNSLARFFADVVPYWCADVPDSIISSALQFDRELSPNDPIRWIVLTWIATLHTNRGEYDLALDVIADAARIFQVGYTYMQHAMLLTKAGRPDAAAAVIRKQRKNWPLIGAKRYAASTIPRLCREQPDAGRFIADYVELDEAMMSRLEAVQPKGVSR